MAVGSAIGGILGGVAGTAIGGPAGTQLGASLGSSLGGLAEGAIKKSGVEDLPLVDPAQAAKLQEIERTKRQIAQGTDPLTQSRLSEIQKIGQTAKGELGKFTGGDVGGTIAAQLRAQRNIQQGSNQAFTQSQQRLPFFENLAAQLGNRISQRKLDIQQLNRAQALGESAQATQEGTQNILGALPGLSTQLGGVLGGRGADTPIASAGLAPQGGFGFTQSPQILAGQTVAAPGDASAIAPSNIEQIFSQGLSGANGIGGFGQLGTGFQL